jgi:cell division protein FtsB
MLDNGCELSDERIAKNVSSKIMLLTLNLFVSLLLTQLHSFSFHSFLLLQQKLEKAKSNAKTNAKKSLKLEETKKAKNNKLRAQGVGIDANLRRGMVEAIALRLVEQIKLIVEDGEMLYVLTSQSL